MKPITPQPSKGHRSLTLMSPARQLLYWGSVLLTCMIVGLGSWIVYDYFRIDFDSPMKLPAFDVEIVIEGGDSFTKIARQVVDKGLLRSARPLRALAKNEDTLRKLKPGHYLISSGMSVRELHDELLAGAPGRVTFPEGYRIEQMADRLVQRKILDRDQALLFIELANSQIYIERQLGMDLPSLEGYLWPDTYFFSPGTTVEEIITRLVDAYRERTESLRQETPPNGLSWQEIVILASMIEKETSAADERAIIASVYYNRLKKNYYLQCDATVRYAVGAFGRGLTKEELDDDHPYNTYKHYGLPPGPIGSPGLAALEAAMKPADTPYLYYCLKNDGTHAFAKTNKEHNRNVRKYLR